ncbi:unnamed protein product, partial [Candidula unifasciata]
MMEIRGVISLQCLTTVLPMLHLAGSETTGYNVHVAVEHLTPVVGLDYYIPCTLIIDSLSDMEKLYTFNLIFALTNLTCSVSNWQFCETAFSAPQDGSCGCNWKTISSDEHLVYSFYFYIRKVIREHN